MQTNTKKRRVLKKTKRFRSAFTTQQTDYLEEQYKKFQYINKEERQKVASILKIGERPIKIWFQNRRMKEKKENHKEFDDEICGNIEKIGNDQLSNVPALPTTNDVNLNSLPILSSAADTIGNVNNSSMKANIVESEEKLTIEPETPNYMISSIEQKVSPPRANFYKELNSQDTLSPYFHQPTIIDTTIPFTTIKNNNKTAPQEYISNASAEFSINLCKKYKQSVSTDAANSGKILNEDQKMKTESKQAPNNKTDNFSQHKDLPPSKKCKLSYPPPPKLPTQLNLNNPLYYPVVPSVYSSPMTSLSSPYVLPDGVLWNPVNFMPVMATNSSPMNIGHQAPPAHAAHEPIKTCMCNCHATSQHIPITFPPSLQNPYAQYVITVPFPHSSSSF